MHYCFFSLGSWEGNASLVRLRELGAEFIKRGICVTYLLDDLPYNRQQVKLPGGAAVEFLATTRGWSQFSARRAILRGIGADYVHVLNPSPKSYLTLRRGLPPRLRLVADWDEWVARKPLGLYRRLRDEFVDRWHRRRAALCVVASKYMQQAFAAEFNVRPVYLPYAAYLEPKPQVPSPFAEPTAVYMGNLFPGYDHDLVFRAAVLLRQRGLAPRIEFCGAGSELDQWCGFVREQRLENVIVSGFVTGDDLWARLRHAHLLLFPIRPTVANLSRCPSKTYAYAQTCRPVITCRVGEIPEVLGDRATYVEPDVTAFADAIAAAMAAPRQPDVDYGVERHNWAARADTLLEALKRREAGDRDSAVTVTTRAAGTRGSA